MDAFSWAFESRFERGRRWYAIAATIAISATIVSFLLGAYLFGIVVIIFTGVYLLYDVNTHSFIHVRINTEGVSLEDDFFPYTQIQSFAVIRVDNVPLILRFNTKSRTVGVLDLYLDPAINTEELRAFLISAISEEEHGRLTVIERILLGLRL